MSSLREFVTPRIPVVPVVSEETPPDVGSPPQTSEPTLKWGGPAYLNFSLDLQDMGVPPKRPQYKVNWQKNEDIIRHGSGVKKAVDHDGETVAESINDPLWGTRTLFHVGKFDENTEETKQVGTVTIIKPTITHVDLYVQWDDIFNFALDIISEENDFRPI